MIKKCKVSAKGRKEKGRRLELKVAKLIREKGLDKNCRRMPLSGASWSLKADIFTDLPIAIECKNTEKHSIWKEWGQAQSQVRGNEDAVLMITSNHRPILAIMDISYYLNLLKTVKDLEEIIEKYKNG